VPSIDKINVIITQPRRMAAMSMADRVSFERGVKCVADPHLFKYHVVILDEAH